MSAARSLSAVLDDRAALAGFSRLSLSMVLTNPQAPDNPIVYVNDAFERTTGYSRSSVVGRNCRFLQGERTRKEDVDKIRTAVEGGRDVTVDILNYRSSGEPFNNRLIIAPILGEDGSPLYFLGLQKEIRDGEENELVDQQLNALRARVRDDLSLVLATISEPSRHQSVDDPMHEVEALPRRLDCLQLAYEEMKLTDNQVARHGIDLGSLISRVAANVANNASRPGLRFSLIVDPYVVDLDIAVRVALILSETLSNAFEHAFDGLDEGCVELRAMALAAGGLRLLISDDGVGIPAKIDWPNPATMGGRLIGALLDGLDATINVARGAAGTIVMIDIPAGLDASKSKGD
ncbi:PAS domain-containing protein [Litorisediminicola beolgyonensis]|uniref:PAS domain-containing protein n=1 Tax=Litorisediminicola beolgyonensis TaxID=1173614 RepID=A0ABW3ZMU4_9RHOB